MSLTSANDVVALVQALQDERNELLELLAGVADSVAGKAPDGAAVAYLSADLLDEIHARTS